MEIKNLTGYGDEIERFAGRRAREGGERFSKPPLAAQEIVTRLSKSIY